MVTRYRQNGLLYLVLENDYISATILPAIGGKMLGLTKKKSRTQFLLQPPYEYSKTQVPNYGADYLQYGPSGFDECFPSLAASTYPLIHDHTCRKPLHIPDHGELWGIPWSHHITEDFIYLRVKGVRFNYEFSKTIRVEETTICIEYRVVNLSERPFVYIWSAQPLLKVQPDSNIILEQGIDTVLVDWATDSTIGKHGEYVPWPGGKQSESNNFAIVPARTKKQTVKLYTDKSLEGFCAYRRADTGEKITFEFDPQKVPYVGILLWYDGRESHLNQSRSAIALQPSSGRPDVLQQAYARNEYSEIAASGMEEWTLRISLA